MAARLTTDSRSSGRLAAQTRPQEEPRLREALLRRVCPDTDRQVVRAADDFADYATRRADPVRAGRGQLRGGGSPDRREQSHPLEGGDRTGPRSGGERIPGVSGMRLARLLELYDSELQGSGPSPAVAWLVDYLSNCEAAGSR